MGSIFDEIVTQAREDRSISGTEFRLFHAIVQIYKSNPDRCNLSQRKWGQLAGTSYGGIGEMIAHLEGLGYIRTNQLQHRGHQSVYITVLKNGEPIIPVSSEEALVRVPRWEEVQSYELPENGGGQVSRYRVVIEEWREHEGG